MEDGEMVYDFGAGENNARFIARVQEAVDACRAAGADYVVALGHLGMDDAVPQTFIYSSITLVSETTGIDVLLDGHSHTVEPCRVVKNKAGVSVPIAQTGTGLENFGQLVISAGGVISVGIVTDYTEKDATVTTLIEEKTKAYQEQMNLPIGHSNVTLSCSDENGVRLVRSRETAIGNFVADAYRLTTGADIGLINGGGVRADLAKGDVTFGDLIAVNPYGNSICVVEVTGQELLDMFEYFCRLTLSEYTEDGRAIGENGSFQQVSGLRFTVDPSIASSVTKDADETFLSVGETRRIKNMEVLKDGVYTPIDPAATYTIASTNYLIKNGGCGMGKLLAGHRLIVDEAMNDYQLLADYLTMLNGDLSAYATVDGRITVE